MPRRLSCRLVESGFTLPEVLMVTAVTATVIGSAIPMLFASLDDHRTGAAARYLASKVRGARMEAVKRSAAVALKFGPVAQDYTFTLHLDGNRNGVRSADIRRAVDPALGPAERLRDNFPGVSFGLLPGVRDVDGGSGGGTDGVRIGASDILTLSPDGTATPGTLYVCGRRAQYAVRVLGVTGRTRLMKYERGTRTWIAR